LKEGLSISEIAGNEGLSIQYVSKIMAHLKKCGLLEATRGVHGGYQLTRAATAINLSEVMRALGGVMFAKDFCSEHTGKKECCVHDEDCSIRSMWGVIYKYMDMILEEISLAGLLGGEEKTKEMLLALVAKKAEQMKLDKKVRI
jgi:Rrf2 family iron-sulfur cluster assembly transcriptional regulator